VYILWDEPESPEPSGWYQAVVLDYLPDGQAQVEYFDNQTETVNFRSIPWELTSKNAKHFIKTTERKPQPPKTLLSKSLKYAQGKEHKITAFADDMSIISSTQTDHQSALQDIDSACKSISLHLKPAKCVSIVL
jgi:hypothetical protein